MSMSPGRWILLSLVFLCGAALHAAPKETDHLTPEDRRLFEWFDQLGIEDITHARLVRVRTGNDDITGEHKIRHNDEPRGFLLWEQDGQFRALLGDLTVATWKQEGSPGERNDYVGWRIATPESETEAMLRVLSKKTLDRFREDRHDIYTDRLDLPAQAFVLARYCVAVGKEPLAARLMRATERWARKGEPSQALNEYLQDAIGGALAWRAMLAMADPQLDRRAQALLFQGILDHCPKSHWEGIEATLASLRKMAEEDDAHPTISADEISRLEPAGQAREWVFQLRNDNTQKGDMWPRPWPFDPSPGNGATEKLKALGLAAVPALLEALDDDRPTRSVFRNQRFGGGAMIQTVHENAAPILNDIVGVDLFVLVHNVGIIKEEERWNGMRALARDWWETTREKGDLEWLRARVLSGEENGDYCLDAIAKRHPDALPGLIVVAAERSKEPAARAAMMERLKKVETRDANDLLLEELHHGPTLGNRVVAAYALRERHQPAVLEAMLAEVKSQPTPLNFSSRPPQPGEESIRGFHSSPYYGGYPDSPYHLLYFLFSSDSPQALDGLRELLGKCDKHVLTQFLLNCSGRLNPAPVEGFETASPATRAAIETWLVSMLDDNTIVNEDMPNGLRNPRLAELGASQLAAIWPSKYAFDPRASARTRATQLSAIRARLKR